MNRKLLNELRLEGKLIQSRLKALQTKLSTGNRNTRKHQSDAELVTQLTLQLSQVESEISIKTENLKKLKSIDISNSPIMRGMFNSPPPKIQTPTTAQESELNETFEQSKTTETEKTPIIEEPHDEVVLSNLGKNIGQQIVTSTEAISVVVTQPIISTSKSLTTTSVQQHSLASAIKITLHRAPGESNVWQAY